MMLEDTATGLKFYWGKCCVYPKLSNYQILYLLLAQFLLQFAQEEITFSVLRYSRRFIMGTERDNYIYGWSIIMWDKSN